jgi:UDP-N-acetylglucosamine--N-acetylmuramyl-(pentapeptide) pyrophosphoryl-undecaprenol N-acetylglucosamine transferase
METALEPEWNRMTESSPAAAPPRETQGEVHPPVRVLITGGGTGGHVYPGLAVAAALRELAPGTEVRFAGTSRGIEAVLVPRAGYRFTTVPASGLRGLGGRARILFLWNFFLGFCRSVLMLLVWRPQVVLGTGGFVSAPVMLASRVLGIPCALQEQNSVPGSTNRLVGRWARRIYLGFGSAVRFFKATRCLETGNPVRTEFVTGAVTPATLKTRSGNHLLVCGGSRGAATLNAAVIAAASAWCARPDLSILIQTGSADHAAVATAFSAIPGGRVKVVPYIEDMATALKQADLVVSRAGAMTLAELQCVGCPAVLVPFPHATDDHQLHNAEDCAAAGAAVVLQDANCDGPALVRVVDELLNDPARLGRMSAAAASLARPTAAVDIAADLWQLIAGDTEKVRA